MPEQPLPPPSEQIESLRGTILSRGWTEIMLPQLSQRMDQAKEALVLPPELRTGEWKDLSNERLAGMVQGLGWARNVWLIAIQRHDAARALLAQQRASDLDGERGIGHPHAPDVDPEQARILS